LLAFDFLFSVSAAGAMTAAIILLVDIVVVVLVVVVVVDVAISVFRRAVTSKLFMF